MVKKSLTAIWILLALVWVSGCGNAYHAKVYDRPEAWLNEEILFEAYGKAPKIYTVTTQEAFNGMFRAYPHEIDFANEMLLVYVFTNTQFDGSFNIKSIAVDGDRLTIGFGRVDPEAPHGDMNELRCLVVQMDALSISEVEFFWV